MFGFSSVRRSLPWRIGFMTAMLGVACNVGVAGVDAARRFEREGRELRRSAASLLAFVEADVRDAVSARDRIRSAEIAASLATLRYVRRVELLGETRAENPIVVRLAAAEPVARPRAPWALARAIQYRFLEDDGSVNRAILARTGERIGSIRLIYDTEAIADDLLASTARQAAMALVAAALLGLAMGLAAWRWVARPIRRLGQTVARLREESELGNGSANRLFAGDPRTEIGELGAVVERALRRSTHARSESDRLAVRDPATGASTRVVALDHLRRAILTARRARQNVVVAVALVDGASPEGPDLCALGDSSVLRCIAERLRGAVRDGDVIARIADSAFLIVADQIAEVQEAADLAARLHECLRLPPQPGNAERSAFPEGVRVPTLSVGVAIAPEDGDDAMRIVETARAAARAAAAAGGDDTHFHSRPFDARTRRRRAMERALAVDIDAGRVQVHAQPKVRCADGMVDSVELLARWNFVDDDGVSQEIPPSEFVALAEDCGLIARLGDFVMAEAMRLSARLRDRRIGVAFNVSAREMAVGELPLSTRVISAARLYGADPANIEIEITESVVAGSLDALWVELAALREHGVRISVDDFGTGAANFSYLQGRAFTGIKIDASFVATLPGENRLASAIANLAHVFGLECVAEGVENAEQAAWLAAHGVERLQGFHFHRPIPLAAFEAGVNAGIYDRPVRWEAPAAVAERTDMLAKAREAGAGLKSV